MPRELKFRGTFGLSPQPVAGVTLYQERKTTEPSLEEMMEELGKSDIREARKEELLAKMEQRIKKIRGTEKEEKAENPKRYLVDPETGRIDVVDDGEYIYKDALAVSASIKGKSGDYDGAINLINAAKALTEGTNKPPIDERKKEFYVDDEGIIHHDPENGELTLSEARAVSQSQKPQGGPPPSYYVDPDGNVHQTAPGQPVVVKQKETQPGKNYMVDQSGNLKEISPGQPIVVRVESPREGTPPTPIQLNDKDGNPMVMDIGSLISWKKFEGDERRAEKDQNNKMEMATAVKDFLTKLAAAAQRTASR